MSTVSGPSQRNLSKADAWWLFTGHQALDNPTDNCPSRITLFKCQKFQVPSAKDCCGLSPKRTAESKPLQFRRTRQSPFTPWMPHWRFQVHLQPTLGTMGLPEDFPTPYYFPLPIGGISDHIDFIPSLLFIACYLAPFVLAIRKAFTSGKRTVLTGNSTLVPIERMVILSFRAIMSRDNTVGESSRKNWSMVEYTQATTGVSTLALLDEISWLLHSLCLFATRENVPYDEWRQQGIGGDRGRPRAEERKKIRSTSVWFSCTLISATTIQWAVPSLFTLAAITQSGIIWLTALR